MAELPYPKKIADAEWPVHSLIRRRWSPRLFDESRTVERSKIFTLLEAARWAPSCFNEQPWRYLVFDGSQPEGLERARACLAAGNSWALRAPALMLSVAQDAFARNGKANRHAQHDVGLASENLVLQAVDLGLIVHQMAGFDAARARSEFAIPEGFTPMAMVAIGYPFTGDLESIPPELRQRETAERQRKRIDEIVFDATWGALYSVPVAEPRP